MKKFAVFDIDGTLIRWQLYHTIVDKLAKNGQLGTNARDTLHEARMRWKRRESGYSFRDYELALIKTYEKAVPGMKSEVFDSMLSSIAAEYQDQVYTYTRDLAKTLKQRGYVLLAISGSHQEIVAEIAQHYGFDDWVGTTYERINGAYTGKKQVGSHDKHESLMAFITRHNLTLEDSYAIGDSKSDAAMLAMVQHPIAFNPDSELFETAKSHGWDIVIERKNVVYTLKSEKAHYTLEDTRL